MLVAGRPAFEFLRHLAWQRFQKICWAADCQMVLSCHDIDADQLRLVEMLYGGLVDEGANGYQVAHLLTRAAIDRAGRICLVRAQCLPRVDPICDLLPELLWKNPVVVCLTIGHPRYGHAYLLLALRLRFEEWGPVCTALMVNPDPGGLPFEEITWQQMLQRMMWAVRIHVDR